MWDHHSDGLSPPPHSSISALRHTVISVTIPICNMCGAFWHSNSDKNPALLAGLIWFIDNCVEPTFWTTLYCGGKLIQFVHCQWWMSLIRVNCIHFSCFYQLPIHTNWQCCTKCRSMSIANVDNIFHATAIGTQMHVDLYSVLPVCLSV